MISENTINLDPKTDSKTLKRFSWSALYKSLQNDESVSFIIDEYKKLGISHIYFGTSNKATFPMLNILTKAEDYLEMLFDDKYSADRECLKQLRRVMEDLYE